MFSLALLHLLALAWTFSTFTYAQIPPSYLLTPSAPAHFPPAINATYDYVVIGGGTAGLTVATRLASSPAKYKVAVIEAGSFYEIDNGNLSVIPADASFFEGSSPSDVNPAVDWGFITTPQPAMANRAMHYARGKTLGGSSARNDYTYNRGTTESYALWASEVGDASYEFPSFLPYFQKSITYNTPNNKARPANASMPITPAAFSPSGGPLQVSVPTFVNVFSSFIQKGYEQFGLAPTEDFVSGTLSGVQYSLNTIDPKGNTRSSSESSFLKMAIENNVGLKVYNRTMAQKILLDGKTATGVQVTTGSVNYVLKATKEVIVSAGAFQSPQLLMVSGIGPAETLQQHNIPVIKDLPGIGQNMWDHLLFGQSYNVTTLTHSALSNSSYLAIATEEWETTGGGILSNPGGEIIGWEKLPYPERQSLSQATLSALAAFPADWPEIEYLCVDAYTGNNENYITGAPADSGEDGVMYASPIAALVSPLSRGNVTISSADMSDPPVISPNWLTHPADQELAIAAFKRVRTFMEADAMKGINIGEVYPGRNVTTDAEILQAIAVGGIMVFHASCTCKMGKASDPMAVVDSSARVFGIESLRVVDASSFALLPPGHPQATVYALAEKIADDILNDH